MINFDNYVNENQTLIKYIYTQKILMKQNINKIDINSF